jgi:hypothetical protein
MPRTKYDAISSRAHVVAFRNDQGNGFALGSIHFRRGEEAWRERVMNSANVVMDSGNVDYPIKSIACTGWTDWSQVGVIGSWCFELPAGALKWQMVICGVNDDSHLTGIGSPDALSSTFNAGPSKPD